MTSPHGRSKHARLAHLLVTACLVAGIAAAQQSECRRIARGNERGAFVAADGTVWSWGRPYAGNGTNLTRVFPVHVSNLTNVVAVAAKVNHVLAVKSDGTLWAWGLNTNGDLGNGTTTDAAVPVQVSGLTNVVCAATGTQHSLAVTQSGAVWAWGYGNNGRLGVPPTGFDQLVPLQLPGLTNMVAVGAGDAFSLALRSDGTVWAWGANAQGQLGIGSTVDTSTPTMIPGLTGVTGIACGRDWAMALMPNGSVRSWGNNQFGTLGLGTTGGSHLSPALATILPAFASVAGSTKHGIGLTAGGEVWTWGYNDECACGPVSVGGAIAQPFHVTAVPGTTAIAGGGSDLGNSGSLAFRSDGSIWSWGTGEAPLGLGPAPFPSGFGDRLCVPHPLQTLSEAYIAVGQIGYNPRPWFSSPQIGDYLEVWMILNAGGIKPVVVLADPLLGTTSLAPYGVSQLAFSPGLFPMADALGAFGPVPPDSYSSHSTDTRGIWQWAIEIPNNPALVGLTFHAEGYVLDQMAPNGLFYQTGNVLTLTIQ